MCLCEVSEVAGGFADVRWLVNGNSVTSGVITGSALQQANKKFTLSSSLTIDSSEWENAKTITYAALPAPVLTVLPPSSEELESKKATLVCLASDVGRYFADVRWLVNGNSVTSGVITGSALQQANKKFTLSSSLTLDICDWENNKVVTCEVSAGGKAAS
ncbi:immunoglobulin lambda-1 light chain-like, partial [Clarias magur]